MTLKNKWRATFTRRWHSNPDLAHTVDPVGGHSCRVAIIIDHIWPNCRKEVIMAAITHDLAETLTGDIPQPAKAKSQTLSDELTSLEHFWNYNNGIIYDLSEGEWLKVKIADRLDAWMWADHHAPYILEQDDWQECIQWVRETLKEMGKLEKVEGLL